jgi:hypothetical protein
MQATLCQSERVVARKPKRPKEGEVIDAIRAEARAARVHCTRYDAYDLICFLREAASWMRYRAATDGVSIDRRHYHLHEDEMVSYHRLMELILPDESTGADGSAHALLNRLVVRGNEIGLRHTSDLSDGVRHCRVKLDLIAIAP